MIKCRHCSNFFEVQYIGADVIRRQFYCGPKCKSAADRARRKQKAAENPRPRKLAGIRPGDAYVKQLVEMNLAAGRTLEEIADGLFREEIRQDTGYYYSPRALKGLLNGK